MKPPKETIMAPFAGAIDEIPLYVDEDGKERFEVEGLGHGVILERNDEFLEFHWYANEGSVFDSHYHTNTEEYLKVHTGKLRMWVVGETSKDPISKFTLEPDDELTIPPGRDHFCIYPDSTLVTIRWTPPLNLVFVRQDNEEDVK